MSVTVEKAAASDIDALERLYYDVVEYFNAHVNYTSWTHDYYPLRSDAEKAVSNGWQYVARENGALLGSAVFNHFQPAAYAECGYNYTESNPEKVIEVHTLAVSPNARRRGVARALLKKAEEVALEQGCGALRLDTAVINEPARRLYLSCGYEPRGEVDLKLNRPGLHSWTVFEKLL